MPAYSGFQFLFFIDLFMTGASFVETKNIDDILG